MKHNQFFYILMIIIVLFLSSSFIQVSSEPEEVFAKWQILDWNDEIAVAWDWGVSSFVTTNGSYINYTLNHYIPSNFTHPSAGTINVGNLTTQTTNNKTAEVLLLSVYGWFPGLITSSDDWLLQEQIALSAAAGAWTLGTLTANKISYNYSEDTREAIKFEYEQDPYIGNQDTTVIYDMETGVLLEGWTEIFFEELFILHLKLSETNLIAVSSTTNNLTYLFPVTIGLALFILGITRRRITS